MICQYFIKYSSSPATFLLCSYGSDVSYFKQKKQMFWHNINLLRFHNQIEPELLN